MPHKNIFNELNEFIHRSKRTVILTGGGVDAVLGNSEFIEFIQKIGLPCIASIGSGHTIHMAGVLDLGTFGPVGRRSANRILVEADSMLVLGSGLDIDITGFDRESFFSGKEIFIINPDPRISISEVSKVTYVKEKLSSIDFSTIKEIEPSQESWVSYAKAVNKLLSAQFEIEFHSSENMSGVDPYLFAYRLGSLLPENTGIALGISLDVVSVSHSMPLKNGIRTFISKHCGQLGWDIPASIGLVDSGVFKRVVCITGDGSIMFNLQELATLSKSNIPVHIYIYDNKGYNSIRTSQKTHLDGRLHGSDLRDLCFPDWKLIAQAFGYVYSEIMYDAEIEQKVRSHDGIKNLFCVIKIDEDRSRTPRLVSKLVDGKFQSPSLGEQFPHLDDAIVGELNQLKYRYLV
jgi:acetolactate synthase-1/2/3 large subunit